MKPLTQVETLPGWFCLIYRHPIHDAFVVLAPNGVETFIDAKLLMSGADAVTVRIREGLAAVGAIRLKNYIPPQSPDCLVRVIATEEANGKQILAE